MLISFRSQWNGYVRCQCPFELDILSHGLESVNVPSTVVGVDQKLFKRICYQNDLSMSYQIICIGAQDRVCKYARR